MKRLTAFLAAFTLCMLSVAGFAMAAEDDDLIGTWYVLRMEQDGQTMDASVMASMGMEITAQFNEDGTGIISMAGQEIEGTFADGVFYKDDQEIPLVITDGLLEIENGGAKMVFSHEKPDTTFSLAPVVEDPAPEDFEGVWSATTCMEFGIPMPISMMGEVISMEIKDGAVLYTESTFDLNAPDEVESAIEKEFTAEFQPDGTLYVDFDGESVMNNILSGPTGIYLTLHEDGKLSGEIPELTETMELLASMSAESENGEAEEAESADSVDAGDEGTSDGSSPGGMSTDAYILFEKAE